MKRIFVLLAFLTSYLLGFSQQNFLDVVYLKNTHIIKGIIFEQIPFKYLRIYTSDRDTLMYQTDEIEKIMREPIMNVKESIIGKSNLKPGYEGIVEMGIAAPLPPNDFTECIKLNVINGYRFNSHLFLGGGLGLRYFLNPNIEHSPVFNDIGVPLFLDIRTNFFINNLSPFLELSLGYSFNLNNNNFEAQNYPSNITGVGLLFNPAIGINYTYSDKYGINISIGYELQKLKEFLDYYSSNPKLVIFSNCLSIDVGVVF